MNENKNKLTWKEIGVTALIVFLGLVVTFNAFVYVRHDLVRNYQISNIKKQYNYFESNFMIVCMSKEGFNRSGKQCNDDALYVYQYHVDELNKDWTTYTPIALETYYKDAFVIWCISDPVKSTEQGLGKTRNYCVWLYDCMEMKANRVQGYTSGDTTTCVDTEVKK